MRKSLITLFSAGALLAASGSAMADDACKAAHAERAAQWAERFNVTDTQRAELQQIRSSYRPQLREQHAAMKSNRAAVRQLDPVSEGYVADVQTLAEARARLMVERATLRAEQHQLTHAVFTAEQREQMAQARQARAEQRDARGKGQGKCGKRKGQMREQRSGRG